MKKRLILSLLVGAALGGSVVGYRAVVASDHDDGENDIKSRALNLTDHGIWVDDTDITKVNMYMTVNPRSLAGYAYSFSTLAKYRFNVTRVATRGSAATGQDVGKEDAVYEFTFGPPDASTGVQTMTLSVYNGGTLVGTGTTGATTPYALSAANSNTVNSVTIGSHTYKFFGGQREDTFNFDVQRFFVVRQFLAQTFLLGQAATSVTDFATNRKTCDLCSIGTGTGSSGSCPANATDAVRLFNPASCAPDFTKNYNNSAIVLQAPIASLAGGGTTKIFDTWSTVQYPN